MKMNQKIGLGLLALCLMSWQGFAQETDPPPLDATQQWVMDHFENRTFHSGILEYETHAVGKFKRHEFLAFEGERYYLWMDTDYYDKGTHYGPLYVWFDGGLEVTLEDAIVKLVKATEYRNTERHFSVAETLLTGYGSLEVIDKASRISSETGNITYEFNNEFARNIYEFQPDGLPFPVSETHFFEASGAAARTDYRDWYFTFGHYFPREVTKTYTQADGSSSVSIYRLLNIYSLNEELSALWFLPRVGYVEEISELVPRSPDSFFPTGEFWESLTEKYGAFLPEN